MQNVKTESIRNFVLIGSAGAGKTTLTDLMLYKSGTVSRKGSVDEKTSHSDFHSEEHDHQCSVYSALFSIPWKDQRLYFADTPGYSDFCGETVGALQVADSAIIVVDAETGLDISTTRSWQMTEDNTVPRLFFINNVDSAESDTKRLIANLRDNFGTNRVVPFTLPDGDGDGFSSVARLLGGENPPEAFANEFEAYRETIMDTVAESDEKLMERYLEGEELSEEEISQGLHAAVEQCALVPVLCGSAAKDIGVEQLMDAVGNLMPSPLRGVNPVCEDDTEIERGDEGAAVAQVFKSVTDPYVGKLTYLRLYSGTISAGSEVTNINRSTKERLGSLVHTNGKEQLEASQVHAGEIVAAAKLKDTHISDTLSDAPSIKPLKALTFPQPVMSYAVYPEEQGEEEKVAEGLSRLVDEDPTLEMAYNQETRETILSGMGDQHLNHVIDRLQESFNVNVHLATPQVPYRETINQTSTAQYRHKKQSGGHGQFAEVHLRIEPLAEEEFQFESEVVGGNIPKNYIPAVEKGVQEAMEAGPLANCKVINVKAVVYDGKYHPVDSSDLAFQLAARNAFYEAMGQAKPLLLEPVMKMQIVFPEEYMGDVSGDLNSRRGRIIGMDREGDFQLLHAEAPMAETFKYATQLRSLTQGTGTFEMSFDRYEPVPSHLAQKIQEEVAAKAAEE